MGLGTHSRKVNAEGVVIQRVKLKTKRNIFSVEAIEFEKTYMVMDLRHSYGYNAYELSFLLGRRDLYVRDIENPLHTLQYSVNENNYLQQIFNCSIKRIMPGKIEPVTYNLKVETTVNYEGHIVYHIYKVLKNDTLKSLRIFTEEPKKIELSLENSLSVEQIAQYITELFNGKYFDEPKTALMIYKSCQKKFDLNIRPLYVADALGFYTGKRKAPRLITKRNDAGRLIYKKDV